MVARLWDATTIKMAVLNPLITVLGVAAIKVVVVVVVEAQEEAMVVGAIVFLHPETVGAIQRRRETGCHLLLEPRVSVAVCRRRRHLLIMAVAVVTVGKGADTTRATATVEAMVRHPGSTMKVAVVVVEEEEEVIKAIKVGINSHRTLGVMTIDKEAMEGIGVTVAMAAAIVVRSERVFKMPWMVFGNMILQRPRWNVDWIHTLSVVSRR